MNHASSNVKVRLHNISKRYNIYDAPIDRLKEFLLRNRCCYHREYWALKDIDLTCHAGCTGILGPNGAGKSTLLEIIAGTVQPTEGSVKANGRITAILELGSGFQLEYTGRENALMYGMILGVSQEEVEYRISLINEFAELGVFFDQPIKTYSSGMVVRLAFACAIMVWPDILLIDEALAVGDQAFQKKCLRYIAHLKEIGKTIIFVSHDVGAVKLWCSSAVLLNGGRIQVQGDVDEVIDAYQDLMAHPCQIASKDFYAPPPTTQNVWRAS